MVFLDVTCDGEICLILKVFVCSFWNLFVVYFCGGCFVACLTVDVVEFSRFSVSSLFCM